MREQHPVPTEINLNRSTRVLSIAFDDGSRFELPCEYLRVHAPSADVVGHMYKRPVLQVGKEGVNIDDIRMVGQYAVKLIFDDGHKNGLYTWRYLYDLGRNQERYWQEYLEQLAAAGHSRAAP